LKIGIIKTIAMMRYQYHATLSTTFLNPAQAVITKSVEKTTVNFINEISYHFIFLTSLLSQSKKFMISPHFKYLGEYYKILAREKELFYK